MDLKLKPHTAGLRTTERAIKTGSAVIVYVAEDADIYVKRRIQELAAQAGVPCEKVPAMAQLGEECGLQVKTACAAELKA